MIADIRHKPFRINLVVGLLSLAENTDGIIGLASSAWVTAITL